MRNAPSPAALERGLLAADEAAPAMAPFVIIAIALAAVVAVAALVAVLRSRGGSASGAKAPPGDRVPPPPTTPARPAGDAGGDISRVGPYRLHRRLGAGGMGRVFLGTSPGGRTVAVKVVHPDLADDPAFRRRFATEIAAARKVGGFYTAQVVDADPDGDPPWLATAYIPGPSLHEAVRDHGPLPPDAVAALGAGLAEGLKAVHSQGLVHRDLKPGNVILASDGPRLIDFGIARALDATSHTRTHTVLGTAAFMAPEQVKGEETGPACDVFALGCVLAFAATGRSPFGEGSAHAVTHRIVYAEPDLSGLPAPLADLVAACLAKDPAARPAPDRVLEWAATTTSPPGAGGGWLPEAVTEVIALRTTRVLETAAPERLPTSIEAVPGGAPPVRTSGRAAGTVAAALLSLVLLPALIISTGQAIDVGSVAPAEATVYAMLGSAAGVLLAVGAVLLLLRNTAGRWLVAVGGTGLALQAANTALFTGNLVGLVFQVALPVTVAVAIATVLLALLPLARGRRTG
ncbi:Serine_threonine-protein kinase PknD [Nocardiopsis dassonvillei]|uniref:serine/threonine-protein kinase n=1 Tax=Nocardiopsis dassonvillei TaxID=2014 RepID=UPI003F55FEEC